ncbi:hypothetical protein Pflav_003640 [Phytohabitans flavus]|uniref:Anthranilate synthase component I N-terminal domain-containing protein n=1 Tax=Phytohabitans flavus TaxID=1076124 RepID=A0A6F8XJG1_9ACTN|nr:hypothetical protein Pflav_003640 [Phytohabitans flavus]
MTTGVVTPDLDTFRALAATRRVVPVTRRLLADGETPIGVYRKLAGGPGTFLLESAEQGAGTAWSRYSFIGVRSAATLVERDGRAAWLGTPPAGIPTEGEVVDVLKQTVAALTNNETPPASHRSPGAWWATSGTTWCAASSASPPSPRTTWRCPSSA